MPLSVTQQPHGVIRWRIENPTRRNAIDPEALAYIEGTCPTLRGQTVIIEGGGDGPFCAGFDLTHLNVRDPDHLPDHPLAAATNAMRTADATFIANVSGYCIGAGVELAATCDLVVCTPEVWFQIPAARLGVLYHEAGLRRLLAAFGSAALRRLLLLGERIDAREARRAGMVTHLVDAAARIETLHQIVNTLAATNPSVTAGHRAFFRARRDGTAFDSAAHETARAARYAQVRDDS